MLWSLTLRAGRGTLTYSTQFGDGTARRTWPCRYGRQRLVTGTGRFRLSATRPHGTGKKTGRPCRPWWPGPIRRRRLPGSPIFQCSRNGQRSSARRRRNFYRSSRSKLPGSYFVSGRRGRLCGVAVCAFLNADRRRGERAADSAFRPRGRAACLPRVFLILARVVLHDMIFVKNLIYCWISEDLLLQAVNTSGTGQINQMQIWPAVSANGPDLSNLASCVEYDRCRSPSSVGG